MNLDAAEREENQPLARQPQAFLGPARFEVECVPVT